MQESCDKKNKNKMKKIIILVTCIVYAVCAMAQTKIAYLDLYQRGGARHLRTTLMFNDTKMWCGKMTIGKALNILAEDGWIVDQTLIGANRVGCAFVFTRHKFHIILKKEYQHGENPFEKLLTYGFRNGTIQNTELIRYREPIDAQKIKNDMASLSKEIRAKYYELKKNTNSIPDNIEEFQSKVKEYVTKYELLYNRSAPQYLSEIYYLESLQKIALKIK